MKAFAAMCFMGVGSILAADPALTIYNQNFAVVRESVPLDLKAGVNNVQFAGATVHLEPDSVILRDPTAQTKLVILEQNFRNNPVSQGLLLAMSEGKTLDFLVTEPNKPDRVVAGKLIRSGYVMHSRGAMQRYGQQYAMQQHAVGFGDGGVSQPIVEVDGRLRFSLPGMPLFPALADDSVLKPTLTWKLQSERDAKLDAELCYVTGGMSWEADYNVVAPEKGDVLDLSGWVTMDNQSGKTFANARIKLLAGDVQKLQPGRDQRARMMGESSSNSELRAPVSEKAFDEYHLYTLERATTLRDRETKQVEFVRAEGVQSQRIYVYDGAQIDPQRWSGSSYETIRNNPEYGTQSNPKVWVMCEFENSAANRLGMPLPRGRVRFYRRDGDQLQFIGENLIDHTPKDEKLRIYTGNAFDLVGERKRTDFKVDQANAWVDESFEIKVRNRKADPVEIRVVEHLYRAANWELRQNSNTFLKTDSNTVEFRIPMKPGGEHTLTYKVHYSW